MKEPPYWLDANGRSSVLEAIKQVCAYREWMLDACHVRTTHVHVVVVSEADGDKVMNDFKAYATRALNNLGERRAKSWARHGSVKRLVSREKVVAAIRYVINGQGKPMAVWPEPRA